MIPSDDEEDAISPGNSREVYYNLRDEGYKLEDQLRQRDNEINRLKDQLHAMRYSVNERQYKFDEYNNEVTHIRSHEESLANQLADLENEINRGKGEHNEIQQKISITEGNISENDKQTLANQDRIGQIHKELWELRNICDELSRKIDDKQREIDFKAGPAGNILNTISIGKKRHVEEEMNRTNEKVMSLRSHLDKLIQDGNVDVDVEDKVRIIESLEAKIKQDIANFEEFRKERAEIVRDLDYTETKLREGTHHLENLKHNAEVLEKDNNFLKEDLDRHAQRDEGI